MSDATNNHGDRLQAIFAACQGLVDELRQESDTLRGEKEQLAGQLEEERQTAARAPALSEAARTDLIRERDALQAELEGFRQTLEKLQRENEEVSAHCYDVERQNSNFISLYVASTQLHATLHFGDVLRSVKEIVVNLIGAEVFGIYLYEGGKECFDLAAHEEAAEFAPAQVPLGDNRFTDAAQSGQLYIAEDLSEALDLGEPIAIQPLIIETEPVGLLVVYKLLMHKEGFDPTDMDLFDLLAAHAATAIMASQLHARTERKASTLEGLLTLLRESTAASAGS